VSTTRTVVAKGLEPVADAFSAFGDADPTHSSQLAAYRGGELVLDLTVGPNLEPDSLLPVFSSSKGTAAIAIALMVERGLIDLDAPVAKYWPEFGANGKSDLPVRLVLSHQAGLTGVDGGFTMEELLEHDALAERLAAQRPLWRPGAAFLYHGLTIGTLADELVRRTDGRSIGQLLREDVTGPRGIDVWLGTPESEDHRFVPFTLPPAEELMALVAEMTDRDQADAIGSATFPPTGILALLGQINEIPFRRGAAPAASAMASARGLARMYAALRHDVGGPRLLTDDTIGQMSQLQVQGIELGTGLEARFAVIFQVPCPPRWGWGSFRAFGHDGAGGSLAYCDPTYDLALGYTVQQLPPPGGVDARAIELTHVLRGCLR
jgi:CubicO group peptidase (beta-lactamase class C family)